MVLFRRLSSFTFLSLAFLIITAAPTLAQNEPSERDIEFAILERLPPGASIVSFRHETFSDEARGVGRVSVAGSYVLDREYYLTKDGFDSMVEGRAKEFGASKQNFIQFWKEVAYDFGGKPWLFKIASVSYRPGRSLNFTGELNFIRGVDGFRFSSAGISKEIPQGSSNPESSYVPNSPEYNRIENSYISFLKQLGGFCEVEAFFSTGDNRASSPKSLTDLLGTEQWTGSVSQPGARAYGIAISVSDGEVLVEYPELECGGLWKFDEVSKSNSLKFTERILLGKRNCVDNGEVEIFACKGGGIKFEWRSRNASAAEAWSLISKP